GERAILEAIIDSQLGIEELRKISKKLRGGQIRLHEVCRTLSDEDEGGQETASRVARILEQPSRFAKKVESAGKRTSKVLREQRAAERAKILAELEEVPLHRKLVDRIERKLRLSAKGARPEGVLVREALVKIANGRRTADRAKAQFVEANLRLVVSLAKKH